MHIIVQLNIISNLTQIQKDNTLREMSWHLLQLSYQQFVKNNKSISDTIIDKYVVYQKLGSGAFGSVYRGMNDKTKKQVAIKVLDLVAIDRQQSSTRVKQIRRRLAKTQSELMMKVNSQHVMKLYDVYQNKWLKIMVLEFCNGGTLGQQILNRNKVPQKQAIQILKQIILGVADMHKANIIHRDLKTDNIMSHNGIYKIVDLGFARMMPSQFNQINGTVLGTIITMAPQVMRKQKYGLKADIWSIGIIFYEMIYGRLPYQPMKSAEMYQQIIKKDIFPNGGKIQGVVPSKQALTLLKQLLKIDHRQRLGWSQLISQDIFKTKNQLPDKYCITVDINNLKKQAQIIQQRKQQDIIQQIQKQKLALPQNNPIKPLRLTFKQKQQKQKQLDRTEANILQWAISNHLECLKTQLIYRQIILPIEQRKMLDLNNRNVVQLMYLLISRCFLNMSFVLYDFADDQKTKPHPIVINLKKTVQSLYSEVSKKFQQYCILLKNQQDKVSSIIGDRIGKIFKSDSIKTKDKFLTGIENVQFKKQQQILYTYEFYIKQLLLEMKNKDINLQAKLKNYKFINEISIKDLKQKKFYKKVQEICEGYVSDIKEQIKKKSGQNK